MGSFLETPLAEFLERSPRKQESAALAKLGLVTVGDFLGHFPRRYEDRREMADFPNQELDRPVCLQGIVSDLSKRSYGRRRGHSIFELIVENVDPAPLDSPIICRWFSRPWGYSDYVVGQEIIVFGQPKLSNGQLVIDQPEISVLENDGSQKSIHLGRITPVYALSEGISQWKLRSILHDLCDSVSDEEIPELLPEAAKSCFPDLDRRRALQAVHFPDSFEVAEKARRFLALEAFFLQQLSLQQSQRTYRSRPGLAHCGSGVLYERFVSQLPFPLTAAQTRAIEEIRRDLASTQPMNRLLHGDVGSGKTFVALAAILLTVEAGFQAIMMAPTQLLAEQHAALCQQWLEPLGVRWKIRRGGQKGGDAGSSEEEAQVIVGTHALLYEGVALTNPGLIVIDEQHKFGVSQRNRLIERAALPDVLVMTATPIPRTLTMTVYGDLDVSVLDELPAGRGKLVTGIRSISKNHEAAQFVDTYLARGQQAYLVCPLIDPSDKLKAYSVTEAWAEWAEFLPNARLGVVHGSIEREERQAVMEQFRLGEIDILIATTVIEVGVDVPNATIMLIYDADRFGLAQLHQLRGRIGRGTLKSFCLLMCDLERRPESMEKLRIMEETRDGFRIAEADLSMRGQGDLLGSAQSGMMDQRWAEFLTDTPLISQAQSLARSTIEKDPLHAAELVENYRQSLKNQTESLAHVS